MRLLEPVGEYLQELRTAAVAGWERFWFTPADPTTLAVVRICVGTILLLVHLSYTPDLLDHVGPEARLDTTAIETLRSLLSAVTDTPDGTPRDVWAGAASVWFLVTAPGVVWAVHALFLASMACLALGLFTRVASVVAWVGNVSFVHRGYLVGFGLDSILAMLTFYLMLGPSGQALSLDRVLARRRAAPSSRAEPVRAFVSANVVIRLIQVHMCIVYLSAGMAKLQGSSWWDGTAVYLTLMTYDLGRVDMRWIATHDWLWQAVSAAGTLLTLAFEIGFVFLVWSRLLRPLVLGAAVLLHGGIALSMGLWGFSAAMLTGCLAFVPPGSLRWLIAEVFRRDERSERSAPVSRGAPRASR